MDDIEAHAVRFKLLSMDLLTLNYYEDKLHDLLESTRVRIKHLHDGRREHLTMSSLRLMESYYLRNYTICKEVLSEKEDSYFGTLPPLEHSDD